MEINRHTTGLLLVFGSTVAWSMTGLFTRMLTLDNWTMLAGRGIFGAIGILGLILLLEGRKARRRFAEMDRAGWLFTVISTFCMFCFITSLRHTTVAHVAIIYAVVPFVAAALAWLVMGERPPLSTMLASLAALAGVAVTVGLSAEGGAFGNLLAVGMTLSMAAMMVIARRHRDIPVMPAACLSALLSGLISLPLSSPGTVTGSDVLILVLFGLVNSAVGLGLFTLGARLLPAVETALIGALDAPLAPLWVWLFFLETPSTATLCGGAIVVGAVAAHIIADHRTR